MEGKPLINHSVVFLRRQ